MYFKLRSVYFLNLGQKKRENYLGRSTVIKDTIKYETVVFSFTNSDIAE